jgi:hypothetical protein
MAGDVIPALTSLIVANAPLLAVIGSNPIRCFPERIPQPVNGAPLSSQYPCLVYRIVTGTPETYFKGTSDIDLYRVQIDAYASTLSAADALLKLARAAIVDDGRNVAVSDNGSDFDDENSAHRRSADFELWA